MPPFPFFLLAALLLCTPAGAADIRVAVASNFLGTLETLAADFQTRHPEHRIRISAGSSGKLYAQIVHGAPYDLFLSADRARPVQLHQEGLADAPVTYAIGRLVLYAPAGDPRARLEGNDFNHLAIANPVTAPYGAAARELLTEWRLWNRVQSKLVIGENIGQTFQFVHSGNAELGLVALAQVRALDIEATRYRILDFPDPGILEQQAVILKRSADPPATRLFLDFLLSETGQRNIQAAGYASAPAPGRATQPTTPSP